MLKKLALSLSLFGLTSAAIASDGASNELNTAESTFDCTTVTDIPYEECEALVAQSQANYVK
ncbi:MAG: hypothetical protein ABFS56_18600 [Pseudomonadota bacterium]